MPRPPWTPNPIQQQRLDTIAALLKERDRIDQRVDAELKAAKEQDDIPIATLAALAGVERKTIYNHIGHKM